MFVGVGPARVRAYSSPAPYDFVCTVSAGIHAFVFIGTYVGS